MIDMCDRSSILTEYTVYCVMSEFTYLFWHGDTFSIDECEHFVVIHDRVHGLDPECVHGSVEDKPFLVWFLVSTGLPHHTGEYPICPLVGAQVELSVELTKRQGLGIDRVVLQSQDHAHILKCIFVQLFRKKLFGRIEVAVHAYI